ncbi:MAG: hypothetical protein WD801_06790 [Gemmatimonadaceae bacterium]
MMRRIAVTVVAVLPLALALAVAPVGAQVRQQGSPIDDLLDRSNNAYNDLEYSRADTLARQVLALGSSITVAQRTRALTLVAAAAYPDDPPAQRRAASLEAIRRIVRSNLAFSMPQELTWPGLTALVEEAKRTTFGMEVNADSLQVAVGVDGRATIRARSSRPGRFQLTIGQEGGSTLVRDSATTGPDNAVEFRIPVMRNERPLFSSARYDVTITGIDAAAPDTVVTRYAVTADAPPLAFADVNMKMDSSKLLAERTGRFGYKSVLPALLVGGAAFALSSTLRAEGNIATEVGADSKGMAVGGALALTTIVAGFMDRGRQIPANIAANKAYGEAFQKSIADAEAENRRRVAEYRTTLRFDLGVR